MASVSWSVSLTLVLLSLVLNAHAAPTDQIDLSGKDSTVKPKQETPTVDLGKENLSLTEPPPPVKENQPVSLYYPYKQSMAPRIGAILDPDQLDENGAIPVLFGISYLLPRTHSPQVELAFDLLTNSKAHVTGTLRRIFFERESFRPYIKGGLTAQLEADERLASFSDWENYLGRVGVGFEDVISLPMSVRMELEAAIGSKHEMLIFSFGYAWGW